MFLLEVLPYTLEQQKSLLKMRALIISIRINKISNDRQGVFKYPLSTLAISTNATSLSLSLQLG